MFGITNACKLACAFCSRDIAREIRTTSQVASASRRPWSVPCPTHATCRSGRINTAVGAPTAPSTGRRVGLDGSGPVNPTADETTPQADLLAAASGIGVVPTRAADRHLLRRCRFGSLAASGDRGDPLGAGRVGAHMQRPVGCRCQVVATYCLSCDPIDVDVRGSRFWWRRSRYSSACDPRGRSTPARLPVGCTPRAACRSTTAPPGPLVRCSSARAVATQAAPRRPSWRRRSARPNACRCTRPRPPQPRLRPRRSRSHPSESGARRSSSAWRDRRRSRRF